jgi:dihydrofolate reductase
MSKFNGIIILVILVCIRQYFPDTSLIKEKLIDEFYLFINPVAIGNGMTIFKDLNEIQKYTLIESKTFECGKVLLRYEA